jgi:plasmid stabilization system protein ParE
VARKVIWESSALDYLEATLEWISRDSITQADKVEKAILESIEKVIINPECFPPDRFKDDNSGNYRAFETHSLRVAYTFSDDKILILRVRHVKQEPLQY